MLASLLPGLRDIRVPLTVGYFWLLNGWLWFSDNVPTTAPSGDGILARAFDLGDLLGTTAVLAATSFTAYLLGTLLQVPLLIPVPRFAQKLFFVETTDSKATREEYQSFLAKLGDQIQNKSSGLAPHDYEAVDTDAHKATGATVDELRPRLLVANQELYGEYDRLAAEAQFRINVCPPLLALGITAGVAISCWWLLPTVVAVYALLCQGLRRRAQSVSVIQRAVLTGVIQHPLRSILDRFGTSRT